MSFRRAYQLLVPSLRRASTSHLPLQEKLLRDAINVDLPSSVQSLVELLIDDVILHEPGKFLILNKPYGLSCLGYKQRNGGIYRNTRIDWRDFEEEKSCEDKISGCKNVTLEDALPFVSKHFKEPNLTFCFGLKRNVSGPIVLPLGKKFFKKIKNSVFRRSNQPLNEGFHHRALAICKGIPEEKKGHVEGYVTFQAVRDHKEYIFVANGNVKRRSILAKYAVAGSMDYKVVGSDFGCSLVDITFTKFNRHLPRLMLTHLLSPILGDSIYMQRVVSIDNATVLIAPKDIHRLKYHKDNFSLLSDRLSLSSSDIYRKLPIYWHVYHTIFPIVNLNGGSTEHLDLVASAPLPLHMTAMLKGLNLYDAAVTHLKEIEEERKAGYL